MWAGGPFLATVSVAKGRHEGRRANEFYCRAKLRKRLRAVSLRVIGRRKDQRTLTFERVKSGKVQHESQQTPARVTRARVRGSECWNSAGYNSPSGSGRVLVRAQERQLETPHRISRWQRFPYLQLCVSFCRVPF
jgi:hypothetical protein